MDLIHIDGWYCDAPSCPRQHGSLSPDETRLAPAQVSALLTLPSEQRPRIYAMAASPVDQRLQILRLTSTVYVAGLESQGWSIRATWTTDRATVPIRRA